MGTQSRMCRRPNWASPSKTIARRSQVYAYPQSGQEGAQSPPKFLNLWWIDIIIITEQATLADIRTLTSVCWDSLDFFTTMSLLKLGSVMFNYLKTSLKFLSRTAKPISIGMEP